MKYLIFVESKDWKNGKNKSFWLQMAVMTGRTTLHLQKKRMSVW